MTPVLVVMVETGGVCVTPVLVVMMMEAGWVDHVFLVVTGRIGGARVAPAVASRGPKGAKRVCCV